MSDADYLGCMNCGVCDDCLGLTGCEVCDCETGHNHEYQICLDCAIMMGESKSLIKELKNEQKTT